MVNAVDASALSADMTTTLDAAWLAAHPLPEHGANTDKNSRGRVVLGSVATGVRAARVLG